MKAHARVTAEADGLGGTRLSRMRGESPLLLRQTLAEDGMTTVYVVGGAAGPLGGDDLRLDIEVGEGAALCVRTVAASIALPARSGAASRLTVTATVARGATLHWLPEQLVASAGCHHLTHAAVSLAQDANLLWRDELICGRHAEDSGDSTITTVVGYTGRPLLRQSLAVGPGADGFAGPAVLGGAKATGSLLRVEPGAPALPGPVVLAPTAVLLPLTGPAALTGLASLVTATAPDAHTLRRHLDRSALTPAP